MIKTDFFTVGLLSGTSPAQNLGIGMPMLLRMATVLVVTKVSLSGNSPQCFIRKGSFNDLGS
jgi:hypothetical protein